MNSTSIEAGFHRLALGMVVCAVLLGINNLGATSGRWVVLGLVLHVMPLAMQMLRSLRVAGAWFAVFLVSQALVSFAVSSSDTFTMPRNFSRKIELPQGTVPGISGAHVFSTDGKGFRVTRPIAYDHKPSGTLRILAIGGSTTEQALLDDRKTWTHLLQELLQHRYEDRVVEVINAGASGTRAEHHLVTFRSTAGIRPDVVLFLMGVNDWNKHIREHYGSRAYGPLQEVLWKLRLENTILGRGIRTVYDMLHRVHGRSMIAGAELKSGVTTSFGRRDKRTLLIRTVAPDYASVVEQIIEECERQRTYCVFLTQPHAYRDGASPELMSRFWMTPPFEEYTLDLESLATIADTYNRHLVHVAEGRDVGVCDIAAKMTGMLDGFYDDCHFNELGAKAVAAGVTECLLDNEPGLAVTTR